MTLVGGASLRTAIGQLIHGRTQSPTNKKLGTRVNHIWVDRRGQPIRSAMERPRLGRAPLVIRASSVPGKYASQGFYLLIYTQTVNISSVYCDICASVTHIAAPPHAVIGNHLAHKHQE